MLSPGSSPLAAIAQISALLPPQLLAPVKCRNVASGPLPRRVTLSLALNAIPVDSAKVPDPSCTCCPAGQFAIAVLIAAAVPVYGAMVGPHCVDLTGIVPAPARLQSMLLVGATIVCWASTDTEIVRTIRHTVSEC